MSESRKLQDDVLLVLTMHKFEPFSKHLDWETQKGKLGCGRPAPPAPTATQGPGPLRRAASTNQRLFRPEPMTVGEIPGKGSKLVPYRIVIGSALTGDLPCELRHKHGVWTVQTRKNGNLGVTPMTAPGLLRVLLVRPSSSSLSLSALVGPWLWVTLIVSCGCRCAPSSVAQSSLFFSSCCSPIHSFASF